MPVPTAYTEAELAAYMHSSLSTIAVEEGWSVAGGSYDEAVVETLLSYGVDTIADATGIQRLRIIARREAWRAMAQALAGNADVEVDGVSAKRSQRHQHALKMMQSADEELAAYDSGARPSVGGHNAVSGQITTTQVDSHWGIRGGLRR